MVQAVLLFFLALIDNGLCYAVYITVRSFDGRLYNLVDARVALLSGLGMALLILAILGSAGVLAVVFMVGIGDLPLFHEIMSIRTFVSVVPCAAICGILVFSCQGTQVVPCVAYAACTLFCFCWSAHMRLNFSNQFNTGTRIVWDLGWTLSLFAGVSVVFLYAMDELEFVTQSDDLYCPFAENNEMPLQMRLVGSWHCAPWNSDAARSIARIPVNQGSPVQLNCLDSFVSGFGASLEAHTFTCPSGCVQNISSTAGLLYGCGTYSLDSSVCLAAIHVGALTNQGGSGTVYGRLGLPVFEACSRSALSSQSRYIVAADTAVTVTQPGGGAVSSTYVVPGSSGSSRRLLATPPRIQTATGVLVPQAFHFNNLPATEEFVWLKEWQESSSKAAGVDTSRPWTRMEGTVSVRVAGVELQDEQVRLGDFEDLPALSSCRLRPSGLVCTGSGTAVLRLDFCRPSHKTCPG
jgi:hypothetical protein